MILALVIFAVTYLLMLALPKERPWVALCSAAVFVALGQLGVYDFSLSAALGAVDYNVLLMMSGTMGIVSLFIRSRMPARLAEQLIVRVPNAQWAVCVLALFAGVISAFVDNVATVLMVAPVGLAIARKLKISPVPVIIAIAVSSNLQGAATLVGDTTSILLGSFATLLGALGSYALRRFKWLVPLPPIIANTLIVPYVLRIAYGVEDGIFYLMGTVCAGEILSCYVLGMILLFALDKSHKSLFAKKNA